MVETTTAGCCLEEDLCQVIAADLARERCEPARSHLPVRRGSRTQRSWSLRLLGACMVLASATYTSDVMAFVPNGDFSEIGANGLAGWKVWEVKPPGSVPKVGSVRTPKGVTVSLDDGSKGSGSHSLKLTSEGLSGDDDGVVLSQPFPLVPGFEYEMSVRYRAEGLIPETPDRAAVSALSVDLLMEAPGEKAAAKRIQTSTSNKSWVTLNTTTDSKTRFMVMPNVQSGTVRIELRNKYKNAPATVWVDEVRVEPLDPVLPNGGFEAIADQNGLPQGWTRLGAAKTTRSAEFAHAGRQSIAVSDAPDRSLSGLSLVVPVRADRSYVFSGYVKGGLLNPNGVMKGGALEIQFLDSNNQPLGSPQISPAVGANTEWTQVSTPRAQPPRGTVTARLTAGLSFTTGTAWFDDLSLSVESIQVANVAQVKLRQSGPSEGVRYATNLLANGDVEAGENGKLSGWTYVGKAAQDWTDEEIKRLHTQGRPDFSVGRGKGEWSHDTVYSGKGALLNVSIDPPLSTNFQWYGQNPVDGYWLSAPAPCEPGKRYVASAWLRPGKPMRWMWLGPLEVRFYDAKGEQITPADPVYGGMAELPAGKWNYYATLPYTAPPRAVTLRLRFGQEFSANEGGWGRTYGDNFALWELPATASLPDKPIRGNDLAFRDWFRKATADVKPPFLPAPAEAPAYVNIWGGLKNSVAGNLYYDPKSPISASFWLLNLLGEARTVSLRITRYDAWGNAAGPAIQVPDISLAGGSTREVKIDFQPSGKYGAFYFDAEIFDRDAVVGTANGRYAVMPPSLTPRAEGAKGSERPGSTEWENPFGVTVLLDPISSFDPQFKQELGVLLKGAGFGMTWVRMHYDPRPGPLAQKLGLLKKNIAYYHGLGLRTIVQLIPDRISPINPAVYRQAGQLIGTELKDQALAIGNWGIEQVNSKSGFRGSGKDRWTDEEFDTVLAAQYDGIKAVAPALPVLVGNIATDLEAVTIRRLYGPLTVGKFDGAILNAYFGLMTAATNTLKVYDAHGDATKAIWSEEQAEQRSPFEGEARRYGEIEGANNMVRTWVTMLGKLSPRLKSMTMWGFINRLEEDIMMVTPSLQPRPQYVAHAVMADALRGADHAEDRSIPGLSIFSWRRPDGDVIVAWANAGERELDLSVPAGKLTMTDIMGNSSTKEASHGVLALKLTTSPVYLRSAGKVAVVETLH